MSISGTRKSKRGRPPIGSVSINVRLAPELLEQLDRIAGEAGVTRPQMLRSVFAEWLESYEPKSKPSIKRDRPVMVHLRPDVADALDAAAGEDDRAEIINDIVLKWLTAGGYLKTRRRANDD